MRHVRSGTLSVLILFLMLIGMAIGFAHSAAAAPSEGALLPRANTNAAPLPAGATPTPTTAPGQYCSTTEIPIVDNTSNSGTLTVTDTMSITDLNVILTGTHSWVGDTTITISDGTTSVIIAERPGNPDETFGCNGNDFPGIFADDEGLDGSLEESCQPEPAVLAYTAGGRYTPNNALSSFDGSSSAATWTLTVADAASPDTGSITSWCVEFNATSPGPTATPTVTNTPGAQPDINVTPSALTESHDTPQVTTDTLTIQNLGGAELLWSIFQENLPIAPVGSDITAKVTTAAPNALLASANGSVVAQRFFDSGVMPLSSFGMLDLTLDDGTAEDALGLTNGGQFIWFNRFSPDPADYPFTLTEIQFLTIGTSGCTATDTVDFYVYEDADGDPANGASFVASVTGQTVGTLDTLNSYPANIVLDGPGDVLIMAVNRTCSAAQQFPAAIDLDASQTRSWLGFYGGTVANPPVLPAPQLYGTVDSLGFPGNWLLRGVGTTGGGDACDSASNIPWLTISPTSGATAAGLSSAVTLTYDSTGLADGTYNGNVCVESNDPNEAFTSIPVTLNVGVVTAVDMGTFTSTTPAFNIADVLAVGMLVVAGAVLIFRRK